MPAPEGRKISATIFTPAGTEIPNGYTVRPRLGSNVPQGR